MIRRLLAALVVLAVATVMLVLLWPQLFGGQQRQYVAQVVAFRSLMGLAALVGALVLLAVAVTARRLRRLPASVAVVLLVFAAVDGGVLASRGYGDDRVPEPAAGPVTVMAWNTLGDATGADAVSRIALAEDASIVALPETSLALATRIAADMAAAGRPMQVTHRASGNGTDRTTALLTATRLGDYALDRSRGDTSKLPTVVAVPTDGTGPTIVAAHPIAPIPRYLGLWQRDLSWLADLCGSGNVVMAGDFNSTVDHYADLSATAEVGLGRCRDAATIAGDGAVGTWPTVIPAFVGAPIDHVMASPEWEVVDVHVVTDADDLGSDHRPVVATLTPSAG
jgi:endonuclease/exonuclease/phosphatase (EEP) superfamily protein YafD